MKPKLPLVSVPSVCEWEDKEACVHIEMMYEYVGMGECDQYLIFI